MPARSLNSFAGIVGTPKVNSIIKQDADIDALASTAATNEMVCFEKLLTSK